MAAAASASTLAWVSYTPLEKSVANPIDAHATRKNASAQVSTAARRGRGVTTDLARGSCGSGGRSGSSNIGAVRRGVGATPDHQLSHHPNGRFSREISKVAGGAGATRPRIRANDFSLPAQSSVVKRTSFRVRGENQTTRRRREKARVLAAQRHSSARASTSRRANASSDGHRLRVRPSSTFSVAAIRASAPVVSRTHLDARGSVVVARRVVRRA